MVGPFQHHRFALEIAALMAFGAWGWVSFGWTGAIALPIGMIVLWGIFAVPGDPSRSGGAPVPVPGWLRLILELTLLYSACWALFDAHSTSMAIIMAIAVSAHYLTSGKRLRHSMPTNPQKLYSQKY